MASAGDPGRGGEIEAPATRPLAGPSQAACDGSCSAFGLTERHALAAVDPRATVWIPAPDQHPVL